MTLNMTTFDAMLKEHYTGKPVKDLAYLDNPFFAMVPKATDASDDVVVPIKFRNPNGASNTFSNALANAGSSGHGQFKADLINSYQIVNIDNKTIEATKNPKNAFLKATKETDWGFNALGNSIAHQLYRTSGGSVGVISTDTTLASTTLVFTDSADLFNIQVGTKLAFGPNADGSSLRDSGETVTVTAINREAGSCTVGNTLTDVASIAQGDYIFIDGNAGAAASGLADYLPATAAEVGTLHGLDRSVDVDRLGGIRRTANGEPVEETIIKLASGIRKHGGSPDAVFLNPDTMSDLMLSIRSRAELIETKVPDATLSFHGVKFRSGGKTLTAYEDYNCPSNRLYMLQMDTWCMFSAGPAPQFLDRDGLLSRSTTADAYEARVGAYWQLMCSAPGYNGVGVLG